MLTTDISGWKLCVSLFFGILPMKGFSCPYVFVNVGILVNAKEELTQLKFVIDVKLDCVFTIDVFINDTIDKLSFPANVTCDVLYKLLCAIIDELILVYKLVQDMFVQLNDKQDILLAFNVNQLKLYIVL